MENIINALNEKFADQIVSTEVLYDFPVVTVKPEKIVPVIQHLHDHPETKFTFLTTLCAIHYPEQKQMAVMYQLHNMVSNQRVRLKIYLSDFRPVTPTITHIFSAANWLERETFDFFGVNFIGHPNLKRILNVEEMIIFPLRKEYPLEDQTREDKNDTMFGRPE
jgi:NADH-quinone oxidoreductase subunit C